MGRSFAPNLLVMTETGLVLGLPLEELELQARQAVSTWSH